MLSVSSAQERLETLKMIMDDFLFPYDGNPKLMLTNQVYFHAFISCPQGVTSSVLGRSFTLVCI